MHIFYKNIIIILHSSVPSRYEYRSLDFLKIILSSTSTAVRPARLLMVNTKFSKLNLAISDIDVGDDPWTQVPTKLKLNPSPVGVPVTSVRRRHSATFAVSSSGYYCPF
eukprot:SAG31_NODE_14924_length_780_cov_1.424376_2_plen_109_part_00